MSDYGTDDEIDKENSSSWGAMVSLFVLTYRSRAEELTSHQDALISRLRPLASKKFQKAYMGIFLFITTALFMIGVSTVAYFIFYYKFIPQVELQRPVHLQFG